MEVVRPRAAESGKRTVMMRLLILPILRFRPSGIASRGGSQGLRVIDDDGGDEPPRLSRPAPATPCAHVPSAVDISASAPEQ